MASKTLPHRFVLRFPPELRDRIAHAAGHYRRSLNSEIVARLEQSFDGLPRDGASDDEAQADDRFAFQRDFSDEEARLLRRFRRLSPRQQAALLELLSG